MGVREVSIEERVLLATFSENILVDEGYVRVKIVCNASPLNSLIKKLKPKFSMSLGGADCFMNDFMYYFYEAVGKTKVGEEALEYVISSMNVKNYRGDYALEVKQFWSYAKEYIYHRMWEDVNHNAKKIGGEWVYDFINLFSSEESEDAIMNKAYDNYHSQFQIDEQSGFNSKENPDESVFLTWFQNNRSSILTDNQNKVIDTMIVSRTHEECAKQLGVERATVTKTLSTIAKKIEKAWQSFLMSNRTHKTDSDAIGDFVSTLFVTPDEFRNFLTSNVRFESYTIDWKAHRGFYLMLDELFESVDLIDRKILNSFLRGDTEPTDRQLDIIDNFLAMLREKYY